MHPPLRRHVALLALFGVGLTPALAGAQEPEPAVPTVVALDQAAGGWHGAAESFTLRLSGTPLPEDARLAVLVGHLDVSALVARRGEALVYRPGPLPLPGGEREIAVYHVDADGMWHELGRVPIRVLTRRGFQQARTDPGFEISNSGRLAQGSSPDAAAAAVGPSQDFTFSTGIETEHRRAGVAVTTRANAVGVGRTEQALRFGQLAGDAPRWDLADYTVGFAGGPAVLALGHTSFGGSRHLVQGHSSRGVSGTLRFGRYGDVSAAMLGATALTGWDDPIGLAEPANRLAAIGVGYDLLANQPGTARFDIALMSGSKLPPGGFDQGTIGDAEDGRGGSFALRAATESQRLKVDAGVSLSRFINPGDPLLAQGSPLLPVFETTRQARYVDVGASLLRGARLLPRVEARLDAAYRHEHVEPLYRSIAASAQADVERHSWEASGGLGALAVQLSHLRMRDNLAGIPSILTSLTRGTQAAFAAPLAALLGVGASGAWLPQASYTLSRTHQFGAGLPSDPEFAPGHVPDQVSLAHGAGLQWGASRWRAAYNLTRSTQDNRQTGREKADFASWTHQASLAVSPWSALDLGVDVGREAAQNLELAQTGYSTRLGMNAEWRPSHRTGLSAAYSVTDSRDDPRTSSSRVDDLNVQISRGLQPMRRFGRGAPARVFLRFARQGTQSEFAETRDWRSTWSLQSGASLTVF